MTLAPNDYDLLDILAEQESTRSVHATFLAACRADADAHGGLVSVNNVRAALADLDVDPHALSSLWARFTGAGRPMRKTGQYEHDDGASTRNGNKFYVVRRWIGDGMPVTTTTQGEARA